MSQSEYDLFLTHLQNGTASGDPTRAGPALGRQVFTLANFIATARRRHFVGSAGGEIPPPPAPFAEIKPALLMGDLNIDANAAGSGTAAATLSTLGHDKDLWSTSGVPVTVSDGTTRGLGITADSTQAFGAGATPLPVLSPTRHTTGTRIDQFLLFEGVYPAEYLTRARIVVPLFMNTTLITWELIAGSGTDLSDHYGVATSLVSEEVFWVEPSGSFIPTDGATVSGSDSPLR